MKGKTSITVAISGASGSIYGLRLVESLLKSGCKVKLLISDAGFLVIKEEAGLDISGDEKAVNEKLKEHFGSGKDFIYYDNSNLFSPLASGSSGRGSMVIIPCSMGILGRIAGGASSCLIERAADVTLKERGTLILVPRESPLNDIHLENMLKLSKMDARIVPAMPGFYHRPKSIDDLINFVVGKILDQLDIEHDLFERWGS